MENVHTDIKAFKVNPLHPNISNHILYTPLHTFPKFLKRRIFLTIRAPLVGDHFLHSKDVNERFSSITVKRN